MLDFNLFESLEQRVLFTALPAAPTNLKVVASSSTALTLQWKDNAKNETGFAILLSTDGATFKQVNTIGANITSYVKGKLKTGVHYWLRVAAVNAAGQSKTTKTAEGIPTPQSTGSEPPSGLAAPANVQATATSPSAITITWAAEGSGVAGYSIERSTDGVHFKQLNIVGRTTSQYTNGKLTAGDTYYYRVRAFNGEVNGDYSGIVHATPQPAPISIAAPNMLQTTALSSTAISLSWADNASNETGYALIDRTDNQNFTLINTTAANAAAYVDTNLSPSTRYYYRVRAVGNGADSAYSSVVSGTTKSASSDAGHSWANGGTGLFATGNWDFDGVSVTLNSDPAKTIPLLKDLHVGSVRIWYTLTQSWDPSVANGTLGAATAKAYHDAGFKVLMVLGDDTVPTYDQAVTYYQHVAATPGLLQNVDEFELGNEPNIPGFWQGTAQQYVDTEEKAGWDVLHPLGATIVGAGPSFDVTYAQTLVTDGYLNYCDIADFHPYGSTPQQILQRAQGAIAAYEGKPTIFTEWNIRNVGGHAEWAADITQTRQLLATVGAQQSFYFTMFVSNTLGGPGGLVNLTDYSMNEPFFDAYKS